MSTTSGASPSNGSSSRRTWGSHQGARDREHLLLAARERARALVAPFKQAREELGNAFGRPRLRASVTPGAAGHLEVLVHREFPEDAPVLRHVADAEPGHAEWGQAANVHTPQPDVAGTRRCEANDALQRR